MAKLTRSCSKCKENKSIEDFPSHKRKPLGKDYICKPCASKRSSQTYTKEEIQIKNKKAMMKMKYNLSLSTLAEMKEAQSSKCLICKEEKELVVDHCHSSGRVRGLLCRTCNSGLGMFKDNLLFLKSAMEYLENE